MKQFLSRKFILAFLTLVSASYLVYDKKIADGVYSSIVIACVAAYITGNVAQKKIIDTKSTT